MGQCVLLSWVLVLRVTVAMMGVLTYGYKHRIIDDRIEKSLKGRQIGYNLR